MPSLCEHKYNNESSSEDSAIGNYINLNRSSDGFA